MNGFDGCTAEIEGVTDLLRNEAASPPIDTYDYTQSWIAADGSGYVEIVTNIAQFDGTPAESRLPADVGGWDDAYFTRSVPTYANLRLITADGVVWLNSLGLGEERVTDIARSSTRSTIVLRSGSPSALSCAGVSIWSSSASS